MGRGSRARIARAGPDPGKHALGNEGRRHDPPCPSWPRRRRGAGASGRKISQAAGPRFRWVRGARADATLCVRHRWITWRRHPTGDEIFYPIDGDTDLVFWENGTKTTARGAAPCADDASDFRAHNFVKRRDHGPIPTMDDALLIHEPAIRLVAFLAVLTIMAGWEALGPRRRPQSSRAVRWINNLAIVALDTVLLRILFPILAVGLAIVAAQNGWGLFNMIGTPYWIALAVSIVALDFAVYLQHVMFHAVPTFWRLHRMHHADPDFDVTTGLRFHPLEILVSMGIKLGVVMALGPPAAAVVVFEVLLNLSSMFNHGNVRIPPAIDRVVRMVVVTPDMHRVHHSIHPNETNSNFGFTLAWWDRLMGTYRAQPRDGHDAMTVGIGKFGAPRDLWLDRLLMQPFLGPADTYPINRRGGDTP